MSTKPEGGNRITGVGDTVLILGADALLEKDESRRPGIYLAYAIKLPTASATKTLGTGEIDHSLTGAVLKTLGDHYFELDFTENFSGRPGISGYDRSSDLLGVYERKFSDRNMFHVEIGGTFATKTSNASIYNLDYLEHSFNKNVGFPDWWQVWLNAKFSLESAFTEHLYSREMCGDYSGNSATKNY